MRTSENTLLLRQSFKSEPHLAEKYMAFVRLTIQTDSTWDDLLDGLSCGGLIASHAAVMLARRLYVSIDKRPVPVGVEFWKGILKERGIVFTAQVGE